MLMILSGFLFISLNAEKTLFKIDDYFDVTYMRAADMTKDGKWLACTVYTMADRRAPRDNYRYGDPTYISPFRVFTYIIDTKTGEKKKLFPRKEQVRSLTWSPDGRMLAFFVLRGGEYRLRIWHRVTGKFENVKVRGYGPIAANSHLCWSPAGRYLHFALRAKDWAAKSVKLFKYVTQGPVIIQDSEEDFLIWGKLRRRRMLMIPVRYDRKARKLHELLPESRILSYRLAEDGSFVVFERDVTKKTDYDVIFGTTNQLEILPLPEGAPKVLLKDYKERRMRWTKDNRTLAWTEKGDVYVMGVDEETPRQLTGETKKDKEESEDKTGKKDRDKDKKEKGKEEKKDKDKKKQRFGIISFSPDGAKLLCSTTPPAEDKEEKTNYSKPPLQYLLIDTKTGEQRLVYELKGKPEDRPKLDFIAWQPQDEHLYFSYSAAGKYDRGLITLDLKDGKTTDLVRSDHLYGDWMMSESGKMFVFSEAGGDGPAEWYSADEGFSRVQKLTDLNPQLNDKVLSHMELISYRDSDGKTLYGILYYPANWQKGKKYPLVTEVYERFFHNRFNATANIFTSAGYAVLRPSVDFETGYPGEAWAKGALSAVNKVIEMGVADPEKLGIQGTSYGGYATVLLITQTDRFKAAINNSGKVNMVSFYTQSPRLGVRNTHAPEKSQDRIGGTMWQYPERYLAHSAILFADRIKTPLLCITGDQDHNVEELQSQEIYYALRRLGKKVVWLRYHNGGHGGPDTAAERKDMYKRMLDWYDKYLKKNK